LVARGLAQVAGFTPSDAAHVTGRQSNWNASAARLGAELFSRRRDGRGEPAAASGEELAEQVLAEVTRASAEAILETAFAEDGLDGPATVAHALAQRAIEGRGGIARLSVALDRPVVGLGASASLHYAALSPLVGNRCLTPDDADVANALGAVVGQVQVRAEAYVSQPAEGRFRVSAGELVRDFLDEREAIVAAEDAAREAVALQAAAAGTDHARISLAREIKAPEIEGRRTFIEARVVATASGRPRIAVGGGGGAEETPAGDLRAPTFSTAVERAQAVVGGFAANRESLAGALIRERREAREGE
jgi:N-methylhydantoinase A/oxoprolinase/acetone carboxylase beta subunit